MAILLGIDTGGTYTDAVLLDDDTDRIIAKAKALTTRPDLSLGIGAAIDAVLDESGLDGSNIAMVSLSTTLATNALVEGQGGRVALILIGFEEAELEKADLSDALGSDPVLFIKGGHGHSGAEVVPLNSDDILEKLDSLPAGMTGLAIAGRFATRNPAHEFLVRDLIRDRLDLPVTCSHELSQSLGGPKRALTALLNARLIGLIDRLIAATETHMITCGIYARLMVVRGDGALISAKLARERPIETILSGPAASIAGAQWLTGEQNAIVSDIGGTTTDVCLLKNGLPKIDTQGAKVGKYRTMVEAVAMRTTGLGGDSEVHFLSEGLQGGVSLGPRRLVPVSLIAVDAPEVVHDTLDAQMRSTMPGEFDGRFVRAVAGQTMEGIGPREEVLLERIGTAVLPLGDVLRSRIETGALKRLVERGLVQMSGVTPSDASHVLGLTDSWDADAARKAMALFGRRRTGAGDRLAPEPEVMARMIISQLEHQTALALLETAFAEEETQFEGDAAVLARHVLMQRGLGGHRGLVRIETGLAVPVIGLGASASTYYPAVGVRLGCEMILPEHAGVANAIGAVVGRVTMRETGTVTSPSEGKYRVHLVEGPQDFVESEAALEMLEGVLRARAITAAEAAGAADIQVSVVRDVRSAGVEGREVFVEAEVTVEASGRPRVAV